MGRHASGKSTLPKVLHTGPNCRSAPQTGAALPLHRHQDGDFGATIQLQATTQYRARSDWGGYSGAESNAALSARRGSLHRSTTPTTYQRPPAGHRYCQTTWLFSDIWRRGLRQQIKELACFPSFPFSLLLVWLSSLPTRHFSGQSSDPELTL